MTTMVYAALTCPLCGGEGTPLDAIPYEEIWRSYARELGVSFSSDVRARHTPADVATLRACDACQLQFFTPKAPGDEDFYNELMGTVSYLPDRWAFNVVLRRLEGVSSLIDVGCGSGVFLRAVDVPRAIGIDRNPDVQATLAGYGIEVHEDLAALAARESGAFDVVCAFEVLEHVDDVAAILDPVRIALRPGGRLFVSVPNVDRARPEAPEPLDLPPHHVSRWSASHALVIAERFGLELVRVDREPRLWGTVVSRAPGLAQKLSAPAGRACMRAAGAALKRGEAGHSLLFEFRAPSRPMRHDIRQELAPPRPAAAGCVGASSLVRTLVHKVNVARSDPERRKAARFRALSRIAQVLRPDYVLTDPEKAWFSDERFFRDFYAVERHDLTADRKYMLRQLLALVDGVPGDTAECGVYGGASSWFICDHFRGSGRVHHGFDSFEGLSDPTPLDGSYWHVGDLSVGEAEAQELLEPFGARLYRGWIPERFDAVADRTFAFVHVDVDLYQPTRDSLEFFCPRLAPGGVILLDDHGFTTCPGATRAAEEYMAGRPESIIQLTTGQAFIVKAADPVNPR